MSGVGVGDKIDRLTVLRELGFRNHRRLLEVMCDCGERRQVLAQSLKGIGRTKSCGCLQREKASQLFKTHGETGTLLYKRWKYMMDRCYVKSSRKYGRYGGRGITVDKRWHDYRNFKRDMEQTFDATLELDRIDNNQSYSKGNCRWATRSEQCRNTSANHMVRIGDRVRSVAGWAEETGLCYSTIIGRIKRGDRGATIIRPVKKTQ